jgi:xanthine phosphoribosyltransferase
MKLLEDRIKSEGRILPGNVLKVSSFLNHQLDPTLIMELGKEFARLFEKEAPNKILTIETSGIPIAFAAGAALKIPVIFAKKHKTSNIFGDAYNSVVHSYTHGCDYTVIVEREFLNQGDRVLLIDDFLANGKALDGLLEIVEQAGAKAVGAGIAIEKGFQEGGARLRSNGLRVESLAIIDHMDENSITFLE